jgi:outer membrane protein assembly factor BamB
MATSVFWRAWVWRACSCIVATALPCAGHVARGGDWPQILGPDRSGIATADERLADRWPAAGPRVVWRRAVGSGFAGVAVVGQRVVLFHRVDDREVVEALDAASGESLWRDDHATTFRPQVGGGDGPLCVPAVHDGTVITFGAQGVLAAHDLATGTRRWSRSTHREFGASEGYFGAGATPVVVAGRVIVNVGGGRQQAGIVAFDFATGATAWQATTEQASYSAPVGVDLDGVPHVLMVTRLACLLLNAADGTVCWQFPFGQRGPTVNAATPLVLPGDRLFVTASYGIGSVCAAFDRTTATPVWQGGEPLASQYGTPIHLAGRLYCIDGRDDLPPADLKCVDAATGRVLWEQSGFGYGTLIAADGKLVAVKADGEIVLLGADPARADIRARARPLAGTIRALPALAAGRLYLRDDRELVCLDVATDRP